MITSNIDLRPALDQVLVDIADYVSNTPITSELAYTTARHCLIDALGCALLALKVPACTRLLGPIVSGTTVPHGARVPCTGYVLDPVQAAFNIGTLIRWLDYNDTWPAAEWGHPSDNFGAILAVADHLSRHTAEENAPLYMREVLTAAIKAYETQGVLALENSFNQVGCDHVVLVEVASTAVVTHMLGGNQATMINALSNAWIDGHPLRTYRQAPNTGPRKSWAVWLALLALRGAIGYPSALTAPSWGFYDVLFEGRPLRLQHPYGSYVIERMLFKIAYPAGFHAQTVVEYAIALHPLVKDRIEQIARIVIRTQESAIRIIDKVGPLYNPADRDHCLQYMVAISLLFGRLTAEDYADGVAADPRIDALRAKMVVEEDLQSSADYLGPAKRSIANSIQLFFVDGSATEPIVIEYPLGHWRRRDEGIPLLLQKDAHNLASSLPAARCAVILELCAAQDRLEGTPVHRFVDLFVHERE